MSTDLNKIAARLGSARGRCKDPFESLRKILFEDMPELIAELRQWRKLGCDPQDVEDICWCQATGKRKVEVE